jgi:heme-degrading monooxygenase HmoA
MTVAGGRRGMVVRMWEARAVPGLLDEFVEFVVERGWPAMEAVDGFAGGELYRADSESEPRLVMITRWRDEAALAEFAGPDWQSSPVVLPDEERFLARPPHVWHFTQVLGHGS